MAMKDKHLINRIEELYDKNCKVCSVKKGRDGNIRTNGKRVRTDKERCGICPIERQVKKIRKEMGL